VCWSSSERREGGGGACARATSQRRWLRAAPWRDCCMLEVLCALLLSERVRERLVRCVHGKCVNITVINLKTRDAHSRASVGRRWRGCLELSNLQTVTSIFGLIRPGNFAELLRRHPHAPHRRPVGMTVGPSPFDHQRCASAYLVGPAVVTAFSSGPNSGRALRRDTSRIAVPRARGLAESSVQNRL
jgi:hypothetical protein